MRKAIAGLCVVAFASLIAMPDGGSVTVLVSHGPVIQDVTPTGATVWVRTATSASVAISFGLSGEAATTTGATATGAANDFTAEITMAGLAPATTYEYRVVVNGEAGVARRFETAPPAGTSGPVDIALFSDSFGLKPAPSAHSAAALDPDLALILGDWDHKVGTSIAGRRMSNRDLLGPATNMGRDIAATIVDQQIPTYAVWDDHDYCANNSSSRCASRDQAMQVWDEYHAFSADNGWPNGIWQRVEYGPADIFMLDMRSNRDPGRCDGCRTMLGDEQTAWLYDRLAHSTAAWKIIVTSVPFNDTIYKEGDSWGAYDRDRLALLDFIEQNDITNVVFASGDIHSGGAIDDGTNSGRPELSVPYFNEGFANTGNGTWSIGRPAKSHPGFAWLSVSATELTMKTYGFDGSTRLTYTIPSEAAG